MAPHTERLKWAESGRYASSAENAALRPRRSITGYLTVPDSGHSLFDEPSL